MYFFVGMDMVIYKSKCEFEAVGPEDGVNGALEMGRSVL